MEEPQHIDCLRYRLIGTVTMPGSYEVQVLHVTCVHEPTALGSIGLHVTRESGDDPDESAADSEGDATEDSGDDSAGPARNGIGVLLTIGSALVLANRIQAAANAALAIGEDPIDEDRAIAQMLARDTD